MQSDFPPAPQIPIQLAFWYGKGGVGKSTTTLLLSLLAARHGQRVLVVDLDPECGTSRDFLGSSLPRLSEHLKTFLAAGLPVPPPILPSGVPGLDLVPGSPDEQRFFRHFPEHSTLLRDALSLLPADAYHWVMMDVPNQFDNIAELGLVAADFLILPVELTADCRERIETVLRIVQEARSLNPGLQVLGALALSSAPRSGREKRLTAKEQLILREYEQALAPASVPVFDTVMFRSATTVEEARSNADDRLLHWTARRRFLRLLSEILARIDALSPVRSPAPHDRTERAPGRSKRAAQTAAA